ncbi:siderophore-interacting protein [Gordonia sp. HNM0687]|uniref:Siderophore-interacting protein n=2 Tax=Gordonia mangrovi TaxID=2665643 RepID=A0A6L7GQ41_9ACTN|nr:siderophore-interacting protein [Gordonia mangrovi]MXP21996.1 siderophore-interacting protein [Gordonia mangrovi]UVF80719.1 siderophore-interacting protein [Gordonia mangrovi]
MVEQTKSKSRGWQGAVLKMLGADDYEFTVTSNEPVTDQYIRLGVTGGGLLTDRPVNPAMWVRIWFENKHGKLHQRAYTLVDPDPASDSFFLEFALHDGAATRWAQAARPGDTISSTFMGSKFTFPDPAPQGWLIAGDAAALPAINSLLDAISASSNPSAAATVWFEYAHDSDKALPLRLRDQDTVNWIRRDGPALSDAVRDAAFDATGHFGFVALDMKSTRAVSASFKNDYQLGKANVKAQAYWRENGPES